MCVHADIRPALCGSSLGCISCVCRLHVVLRQINFDKSMVTVCNVLVLELLFKKHTYRILHVAITI
jgi:hypothetical protein